MRIASHVFSSLPRRRLAARTALALVGLGALATAEAVPITLNTNSLTAGTDAILSINLFDGDLRANNTAHISHLQTDGTDVVTTCDSGVGCNNLPPFELDDALGLGELLVGLKLGSFISFDLSFTGAFNNVTDAVSDLVVVSLLDSTSFALFDTNLDALNGPVPFENALAVASLADGRVLGAAGITTVPEPASLFLLASGVALLGRGRKPSSTQSPAHLVRQA